ncbi:MAG TPA: terminase [Pseudonocardiaceae bacterium]
MPEGRLVGHPEPRLFTPALRPLNRSTSRGFEVIEFAEMLGEPLIPWQRKLVVRALELHPDGTPRFRVVVVLVARQNGKTHVKRVVSLWRLFIDGARMVLGCAQDVSLAREVMNGCLETIQACPDLRAELDTVRRTNGDEWFRVSSGGRYKIAASNRSAGRGLSVDELNIDELREQRSWDAWSALSKTTSARPGGQIWCMSNAGDDESVVLNQLREAALSGADPSIGLFEWSAPEGCDLDDEDAWCAANPGLGFTVNEAAIRTALGTDPPAVFRTEVLCQRVDSMDSAVDATAWRAGADPAGDLSQLRSRVVLCVDVAPDGQHVTLVAAAQDDAGRVRVEPVAAWSSTDAARDELAGWVERVKPAALAWFPSGPAAALGPVLRGLEAVEITGQQAQEACMSFADLVRARRVLHPDDPLLNAHVAGSSKLRAGDGWRFTRRGRGHCDAAYAAAGAVQVALTLPAQKSMPKPMVV